MAQSKEIQMAEETMKATVQGMSEVSRGVQAINMHVADYTRRTVEQSTSTMNQMMTAQSLEQALEIQSHAAKSAYDEYMAEASKIGNMYAELARHMYKPFEDAIVAR